MKSRRVVLLVELDTDISTKILKEAIRNLFTGVSSPADKLTGFLEFVQVQENVIKQEKRKC